MQVVILAGGLGTRLSEETIIRPKPMVEIGGKPILWHIMKIYASYGYTDFVVCLGYRGYMIKEWFADYVLHNCDVTITTGQNASITMHDTCEDDWKVTLIDTGSETMTGGRLKRVGKYIEGDTFLMTYGDGLSNVNISELVKYHETNGKLATLTAVRPEGRFGMLGINEGQKVTHFMEKKDNEHNWINGGFMVLNKKVLDYIPGDSMPFEKEPLETLADQGELNAFKHEGFWYAMDTLQNKQSLESLWNQGNSPWKIW